MAIIFLKDSWPAVDSSLILPISLILFAFVAVTWAVRRHVRLSHIPGPFWAKFTDIPRFTWAWSDKIHDKHIALHRKYGDVVRVGPNCVSVGSPLAIPQIYGTGANLQKVRIVFIHKIISGKDTHS